MRKFTFMFLILAGALFGVGAVFAQEQKLGGLILPDWEDGKMSPGEIVLLGEIMLMGV